MALLASTVLLVRACCVASPDLCADFLLGNGLEFAKQGHWKEAHLALLKGRELYPRDHRFPVELGGIAFREKHYAHAAEWVRTGLKLKPSDDYALDFLGSIHFLSGNPEAALAYWNRVGKPRIRKLRINPALRVDPVLLDRAFTFAPGSIPRLSDWRSTRARMQELRIFPLFDLRLDPQPDGTFDASFTARERNGWGANKLESLAGALRGAGFQTVHAEYFNISRRAANFVSLARWDRHKRRLLGSFSAPLRGKPQYRFQTGFDVRDESWDLPGAGSFQMSRFGLGAAVTAVQSGNWSWTLGGEVSYRKYGGITLDPGAFREALFGGYQLKQTAELNRLIVHVPSRRIEMATRLRSEAGRNWLLGSANPSSAFGRWNAGLTTRWTPRLQGDDYTVVHQVQIGNIAGWVPLDDFYILGMERDNDGPWMRAHAGTRRGRKGSAPLVRRFFVSNLEIDKNVYNLGGLVDVKVSPFVDVGKGGGATAAPSGGVPGWMLDSGAQVKLRVLGLGFALVFGRDLRTGNTVFYVAAGR